MIPEWILCPSQNGKPDFHCHYAPALRLSVYEIPKSRMPEIDQNELIAHVEWNENIHIDENQSRVSQLFASIDNQVQEHTAYVGSSNSC